MNVVISQFQTFLASLPPLETVTFLVLVLITVYRRRLSSNHGYRGRHAGGYELSETPMYNSDNDRQLKRRRYSSKVTNYQRETENGSLSEILQDLNREVLSSLISIPFESQDISPPESTLLSQPSVVAHPFPFLDCSKELLFHILAHCDTVDIVRLSLASRKHYNGIIQNEFLWEQLWMLTYSHIWRHPSIKDIRMSRGLYWDPILKYPAPQYGWHKFYISFELCWIDWILAGLCTREKCYISINDAIFDVTNFVPEHPGSAETLLDHSGGDVSEVFFDIGHSDYALRLMERFCIFDSHQIYLQSQHPKSLEFSNQYYNHMKVRAIPAATPLHDAIRHLQQKLIVVHSDHDHTSLTLPKSRLIASEECFPLAPKLLGFLPCCEMANHVGQCRSFFDPLSREWVLWHTCCGCGQNILEIPEDILRDNTLKGIFE